MEGLDGWLDVLYSLRISPKTRNRISTWAIYTLRAVETEMKDSLATDPRVKVSRDLAQHIRCVAIRMKRSGVVLSMDPPFRHSDLIFEVARWLDRPLRHDEHDQGFLAATGRFISREHAARLCGREGKLFSEDLW
jgi:hypothetical protein